MSFNEVNVNFTIFSATGFQVPAVCFVPLNSWLLLSEKLPKQKTPAVLTSIFCHVEPKLDKCAAVCASRKLEVARKNEAINFCENIITKFVFTNVRLNSRNIPT